MMARKVTVQCSDTSNDGSYVYELRGLEEDEIEYWGAFCASSFSYKPNPPPASYFERHFWNDPERKASWIRVALFQGEIVASCRIFGRTLSTGKDGDNIRAGGIGEVCTKETHRKRGLSKELLNDAIDIMTREGMQISFLHAAPSFFPVYQKSGYQCTLSEWSEVTIDYKKLTTTNLADRKEEATTIRLANFPADTPQLMSLHESFSETKFCGCIVRSEEYWNKYLSKELEGQLWVLSKPEAKKDSILGWLSIRRRGEKWQLKEFGFDPQRAGLSELIQRLLAQAVQNHATDSEQALEQDKKGTIKIHLPTFLVDMMRQEKLASNSDNEPLWEEQNIKEVNDGGWMYRSLLSNGLGMHDFSEQCPHLIWPADSF